MSCGSVRSSAGTVSDDDEEVRRRGCENPGVPIPSIIALPSETFEHSFNI